MSLSLRTVLPATSPIAALQNLPVCASPCCPRPATLWQRWWARHEGIWLHEHWYCSPECFHAGLYRRLEQAALAGPRAAASTSRLPLGLVLLSQGDITPQQLRQALQSQALTRTGKIGEWLIKMGAVTEQQVTGALAAQQGCGVFSVQDPQWLPTKLQWPESLALRYRALPVFHNPAQSLLYVGHLDQVDRSFLFCVEQMLRCRTQPCIVPAETYRRQWELSARELQAESIDIPQPQSSVEMIRTIGNYARQVRAERCSIVCCADRLWTRLEPARGIQLDLLFGLPTVSYFEQPRAQAGTTLG